MLWKIKKIWVAFALAAALLCLCGYGTDDINISGYADEEIVLAGLAEEDVVITIRDMKAMDCVTAGTMPSGMRPDRWELLRDKRGRWQRDVYSCCAGACL